MLSQFAYDGIFNDLHKNGNTICILILIKRISKFVVIEYVQVGIPILGQINSVLN